MTEYEIERMKLVMGSEEEPPEALRARYDKWLQAWHRVSSGPLPVELLIPLCAAEIEGEIKRDEWSPEKGEEVMYGDNGMQRRGKFMRKGPGGNYWIKPPGNDPKVLCKKDTVTRFDG